LEKGEMINAARYVETLRRLKLHSCNLQLVKKLTLKGHNSRKQFALGMLSRIEEDETFFDRLFL
jgi:hypothetical protein